MAPFGLATFVAKSFGVFTCSNTLARVVRAAHGTPVRCLSTQAGGPPKRPLNGYMRYVLQQKPVVGRQNPELKLMDVIRKIAHEWRTMSPEKKRPFEDEFIQEKEEFKRVLQRYRAQLTPAQIEQQRLEKRETMAKKAAIRKKREANTMGKPKRPRTPFNIFMSEHFEEAKGENIPAKMKSLTYDWRNLFSHQKQCSTFQVYTQLAEDDKIRYKNEMESWEGHMVEIGREDLIRGKTVSKRKRKAAEAEKAKTKKKAAAKRPATKAKSRTIKKMTKSSNAKAEKKITKT
ncbi:transcription factor A, mitochondrial isoform X2 [Phyllopteryx taeniolatus]|uniref:transcription factor A, mitochondrial isoform X2 n=1 Tax=Phyllopteryx taeniolatus TaxID=161469 RepID=UPI002AD438D6|nr:transcription factor A, mitochondrial isoform X2 [Phyllopteryx taeniolatus]